MCDNECERCFETCRKVTKIFINTGDHEGLQLISKVNMSIEKNVSKTANRQTLISEYFKCN